MKARKNIKEILKHGNGMNRIWFVLVMLLVQSFVSAQNRIVQSINSNWQFYRGDKPADVSTMKWENISLPHSFNAHDVCDDEPGYYRGATWYRKTIYVPASWKNKDVYLDRKSVV